MSVADEIIELLETRGEAAYFGEPVSQREHALQAAALAAHDAAPTPLIAAALLHDVGHLLHGLGENIADRGADARHEDAGEAWLALHFGPDVSEPVKLHVAAKRYLCATDPEYLTRLSPASIQSLALQGGPFNASEVTEFEKHRYYAEAVQLRRWDDLAKIPGLEVPGPEHYRPLLEAVLTGAEV